MKVLYLIWFISYLIENSLAITTPCNLRATTYGNVCVCNASYCDSLDEIQITEPEKFVVISSSKDGLRFSTAEGTFGGHKKLFIGSSKESEYSARFIKEFSEEPLSLLIAENRTELKFDKSTRSLFSENQIKLRINRNQTKQKLVGFGGAFTGSVSHILKNLDTALQDQIYKCYFATSGINFNMLRIPIGGCDFDLEPWAYNELPRNDASLTNFTKLLPKDELKVQQIERLLEISNLKALKIMAAAWSSPTWMKSNNAWTGFSHLKPEYYQAWADYHLKFLELMSSKNMPIWAISTGNEPLNGVIGWLFVRFMSLGWTPSNQALWLSNHLGPTIKNSQFKNVLIFGNDDQRYTFPAWFRKMNASSPQSLNYLDGLAVHWYWDEVFGPNLIDEALAEMPHKLLLSTESCVGDKPWQTHGPELGSWERGEQYARAYLQDFQHNFNGVIDWNLILNEQGGPNYVSNFVDAPIIVNTTSGTEFYKQPMFYMIGHFSKFLQENALCIESQLSAGNPNADAVAFKNPNGSISVILFNGGSTALEVLLEDSVRGNSVIHVPSRSIHTVLYV